MALSSVVVLCTRHRPHDVEGALVSIAAQTIVADAVVVVDSSTDDRTRLVVATAQALWPEHRQLRYVATTPSLTHQRIVGIAETDSDIVMFVDDDVRLDPLYCEEVLATFANDIDATIGGVGGFIVDQPARRVRVFDVLFGLDSRVEGLMLRSGRNIAVVTEPKRTIDVDWLSGTAMSYRRSMLELEPPDEDGFPFEGEDADLSFRVGGHARLVVNPRARVRHLESQDNRVAGSAQAAAELAARFARVRQHPNRLSHRAALIAAFAQLAKHALVGVLTLSRRHLRLASGTTRALAIHLILVSKSSVTRRF